MKEKKSRDIRKHKTRAERNAVTEIKSKKR